MKFLLSLMSKIYNKLMQKNSNFIFRDILKTSKYNSNPEASTIIYCAVDQPNYRSYLLAIKSLLRFCTDSHVVVQDDGSLTNKSISELKKHIIGITIFSKSDMFDVIHKTALPELRTLLPGVNKYEEVKSIKILYLKFFNVLLRFMGKKVIIIDSDLLFLRKPVEVVQWIIEPYKYDFYGEGSNANANDYYKMGFDFSRIDVANFSSGFIGVKFINVQNILIEILKKIYDYDPKIFYSWEIEQALWSILLNYNKNQLNLDELRDVYIASGWRKYRDLFENAVLVHFAGAFRFKNLRYIRLARLVIKELKQNKQIYF